MSNKSKQVKNTPINFDMRNKFNQNAVINMKPKAMNNTDIVCRNKFI